MRRNDKLVTDMDLLHEILAVAPFGHISMAKGGTPYVIPMSFGFDGKHLYFHSAKSGDKVDILRTNPKVCIQFTKDIKLIVKQQPCDWGFAFLSVMCKGKAQLLDDPHEKAHGLNQIICQYKHEYHSYGFSQEQLSKVNVYRVDIDEITGKQSTV